MSDLEITLTDNNFQAEVLEKKGVILVDFWAAWCGPCQMLAPIIEELAKEYEGKVVVGKLEVDENPQTSSQYQIQGIPSVIFFKDGKIVDQFVGVQPKEVYKQVLDKLIS